MARDVKLIIGGDTRGAESALRELQRTGKQTASVLEREFDMLGLKSDEVFKNKRESATKAYERIKSSGLATTNELTRAQKAHAAQMVAIDEEQYGKRVGLAQKFKDNWLTVTAAIGAAVAVKQFAQDAINEFKEFESALVDVGKVSTESLESVRKKIMDLPPELGSATELVKGYYQTLSAGVTDSAKAMDIMTVAAKASKAAHTDQATVINGMTKLMAGFSGEIKTAAEASDLLFGIEKLGQTTFAELVPVIGDLASISHQVAVNSREMGAALSVITQTAGSTSQAATQYRAILIGLLKPQKTMSEALKEMGFESGRAAVEQLGLAGTLQKLEDYAGGAGISMSKLFESSEALTGLGPLLSTQFVGYNAALKELETNAGATDKAFAEWSKTFEATEQMFKNTIGKVMIEIGQRLAPDVQAAMKGLAGFITENQSAIVTSFNAITYAAKAVGFAVTTMIEAFAPIASVTRGLANVAAEVSLRGESLFSGDFSGAFGSRPSGGETANPNGYYTSMGMTYWNDGTLADTGTGFTSFAVGTNYVPRTGMYQLHRGETVNNRNDTDRAARAGSSVTIAPVINISGLSASGADKTARELARELLPELKRLGGRMS